MCPCVAQLSHPEHWDRLVVHLAVLVPVHAARTCSPPPTVLAARNRAGGRIERWLQARISTSVSRTHALIGPGTEWTSRHHRIPRACVGHTGSSERSLQALRP